MQLPEFIRFLAIHQKVQRNPKLIMSVRRAASTALGGRSPHPAAGEFAAEAERSRHARIADAGERVTNVPNVICLLYATSAESDVKFATV
ncbi:hypothetical protein EVAR_31911_1 [Eumeta japonica]|uniref:Uncharacterized protein n=1 Tax=Eumeta variegata TaxID=151549 RepID=A0A4C1XRJ5_EUMVA|nr:hypothetical protein EVAR_31911_1 [Eumeta japonica]